MIAAIKTFEIYSEKFSQIIQAISIDTAILLFRNQNPHEMIISIEDVNFRESPTTPTSENIKLATASGILSGLALGIKALPEINKEQVCNSLKEVIDILDTFKPQHG